MIEYCPECFQEEDDVCYTCGWCSTRPKLHFPAYISKYSYKNKGYEKTFHFKEVQIGRAHV